MKFAQFITLLSLTLLCSCGKDDPPSIRILKKENSKLNSMMFGHFMEKASWGGEIGGDLVIDFLTGNADNSAVEYGKTECSVITEKEGKPRKKGTILKIPAASVNVMLIPIQ